MTLNDLLDSMHKSPKNRIHVVRGSKLIYDGPADGMFEGFRVSRNRIVDDVYLPTDPMCGIKLYITLK